MTARMLPKLSALALACAAFAAAQTNPLWHEDKVKNYLPHMTWPEVQDLLTRTDMVIIPVPSLEQHGPQTPIGTDFLSGVERAKLVALDAAQKVCANGSLRAVLFQRRDGNDDHIGAGEQVLNFGPGHVGKVVFDFVFMPQRVGLRGGESGAGEGECGEFGEHSGCHCS